eukprot:TRINITY_DN859_c0_g1_i8.p1 TRINITY_DN859_c0_g1~~TRINITY_DN859_c0_g1_i8.p1  ORF type:complete len:953 (-),score=218.79 TRINITY_DN859_c0_g1_i8:43-2901(-)
MDSRLSQLPVLFPFFAIVYMPGLSVKRTISCGIELTSFQLIESSCQKSKVTHPNLQPSKCSLKLLHSDQYIFEDVPLINISFVRQMVREGKRVELMIDEAPPTEPDNIKLLNTACCAKAVTQSPLWNRAIPSKPIEAMVTNENNRMSLKIGTVQFSLPSKEIDPSSIMIFIEAELFFGTRRLCAPVMTQLSSALNYSQFSSIEGNSTALPSKHLPLFAVFNEWLILDADMSSIPKESRICFSMYFIKMKNIVSNPKGSKREPEKLNILPSSRRVQLSQSIFQGFFQETYHPRCFADSDFECQKVMVDYKAYDQIASQLSKSKTNIFMRYNSYLEYLQSTAPSEKRKPLAYSTMRIFDHLSRFASGQKILVLKEGSTNPLGICTERDPIGTEMTISVDFPQNNHIYREIQTNPSSLPYDSPSSTQISMLTEELIKDSLEPILSSRESLIWQYREWCSSSFNGGGIAKVLLVAPWEKPEVRAEIHTRLIPKKSLIPAQIALEMLDGKYADTKVREFAVKCLSQLSWDDLELYLSQLVQALKCETYHDSPLAMFLLERALENRVQIGNQFFWLLFSEIHDQDVAERFIILIKAYLRGCGKHAGILLSQLLLINDFMSLTRSGRHKIDRDTFLREMTSINVPNPFRMPYNPCLSGSQFVLEKCKVLDSARFPILVTFKNTYPVATDVEFIFKAADDLRQDKLAMQIFSIMEKIWLQSGMNLCMTTYQVLPMGKDLGVIEVVKDCTSMASIQKNYRGTLTAAFNEKAISLWLHEMNPSESDYQFAVDNFTRSCAGYCVATYVLGVGDRHNDNILLTKTGRMFHVDFGKILGNVEKWKGFKRESAPFVLTPEYVYVMGGKDSPTFQLFVGLCCDAYSILRKQSRALINLFTMIMYSGLSDLRTGEGLGYLHRSLDTHEINEQTARANFEKLIYKSLDNMMTRINNAVHIAAHPKKEKE